MNCVSRPLLSGSSCTWLSGNDSTRRFGGVITPTGALTMTVAFGANDVPGIRPVTSYEPGFSTALLSVGAGQMTRTSWRDASPRNTAEMVAVSRGIIPTTVSTEIAGTSEIRDAIGDSAGMPAVEISGGGAPRPRVVARPRIELVRIVATC